MKQEFAVIYESPIGPLEITGTSAGISAVSYRLSDRYEEAGALPDTLQLCVKQLDEYFKGERVIFTVPILLQGSEFQNKVWTCLQQIEYGTVRTYRELAIMAGNHKAVRAVGNANGKNLLNILIPCHRVIGSNGELTGYGGGLWRKEWLLRHEQRVMDIAKKSEAHGIKKPQA